MNNMGGIRAAFEKAGIEFLGNDGVRIQTIRPARRNNGTPEGLKGAGPGMRLLK
jgi:hypothetical protein